jgi:hypothetical protein
MRNGNYSGVLLFCEVLVLVVSGIWSRFSRRFSSFNVCAIHFLHCCKLSSLHAVNTFYVQAGIPGRESV